MTTWTKSPDGFDIWDDTMHPDEIPYHRATIGEARKLARRLANKHGAAWICIYAASSENARELYQA